MMQTRGIELIKKILDEKKLKNSSYSLRALSRDIKISQTQLSHLLMGKRRLSPHHALKIGEYLNYNDQEMLEFIKLTILH